MVHPNGRVVGDIQCSLAGILIADIKVSSFAERSVALQRQGAVVGSVLADVGESGVADNTTGIHHERAGVYECAAGVGIRGGESDRATGGLAQSGCAAEFGADGAALQPVRRTGQGADRAGDGATDKRDGAHRVAVSRNVHRAAIDAEGAGIGERVCEVTERQGAAIDSRATCVRARALQHGRTSSVNS